MGEVYRARDTRLQRTVAVKVLPTTGKRTFVVQFASDLGGAMEVTQIAITDDARWYAYAVEKQNSTLFLIEPAK